MNARDSVPVPDPGLGLGLERGETGKGGGRESGEDAQTVALVNDMVPVGRGYMLVITLGRTVRPPHPVMKGAKRSMWRFTPFS